MISARRQAQLGLFFAIAVFLCSVSIIVTGAIAQPLAAAEKAAVVEVIPSSGSGIFGNISK